MRNVKQPLQDIPLNRTIVIKFLFYRIKKISLSSANLKGDNNLQSSNKRTEFSRKINNGRIWLSQHLNVLVSSKGLKKTSKDKLWYQIISKSLSPCQMLSNLYLDFSRRKSLLIKKYSKTIKFQNNFMENISQLWKNGEL